MKGARLLSILCLAGSLVAGVFLTGGSLLGQGPGLGQATIIVPESSVERPEDLGIRAHTNHLIIVRPTRGGGGGGSGNAISSVETPGSLACIYGTATSLTTGCPTGSSTSPPSGGSTSLPTGGSGTIAIVDAFDYPTAASDLAVFSSTFGLPAANFSVVYASGSQPSLNCGWAQEAALDIEWAHAMAPSAKIVLVEANSNSFSDLFSAVQVATNQVLCGSNTCPSGGSGVGEVSMSWGGREFVSESTFDGFMATPGVTYFAASGDSGGKTIYPSASPNVVSCGGTSIVRSSLTGAFVTEQGWRGSGGGGSKFEPAPPYQSVIASIVGSNRGTPDFSSDADPNSGVWVYDTTPCNGVSGWLVFGGTSVATPSLAGIVNLASSSTGGSFSATNNGEQTRIYNCYANTTCYSAGYFDVTTGTVGRFSATTGWDFVTGVGTNRGLQGK